MCSFTFTLPFLTEGVARNTGAVVSNSPWHRDVVAVDMLITPASITRSTIYHTEKTKNKFNIHKIF